MSIQYNSPVVLNYALLSALVLILSQVIPGDIMGFFTIYPVVDFLNPIWYFRLFSHVIGHINWEHLVSNFTLILLIGPILEEKYGSKNLILMILVTALITGILQIVFYDTALLGASGVAFMMILLGSFANAKSGKIPLTFILIVILFLGKEVYQSVSTDDVSQFAHIIGGICGGIFGFILTDANDAKPAVKPDPLASQPNLTKTNKPS